MLERLRIPILAALVLAVFLQAFHLARLYSITYDEQVFIPAGYSYVATGDFRMNREQPPGMKLLFGLPALFLHPEVPTDHESWSAVEDGFRNTQWEFGREFLSVANREIAGDLIFWSRLPVVLLTCLLCILAYLWARELNGTLAGLLAAGLCASSPNLIGHGSLAATDLGVTCFFFLAAYTYWRYDRAPSLPRLAVAGASCGLALLAKFSGVFLLPLYAAWLAMAPRRFRTLGPGTLAIVVIGIVLTSLAYFAPGRVDLYFRDMLEVGFNVRSGGASYLLGEYSQERFPHYFLVAFLVKTPAAILGLLVLRLALDPLHRGERRRDLSFLGFPVVAFFVVISWKASNVGLRYLLPIYPFLFVYIAGIVRLPAMRAMPARAAVVALLLYAAATPVRIHPDQLSYFNDLVGGPSKGIRYLEASNVDWGQNLKRLARHLDEQGIEGVRLLYSPAFDPTLYGIDAESVGPEPYLKGEPGVYVFGVKEARRVRRTLPDGTEENLLDRIRPQAVIGYTLFVEEVPERKR